MAKGTTRYRVALSVWIFVVMFVAGLVVNLIRNLIYGIPILPIRSGLVVLIIFMTLAVVVIALSLIADIVRSRSAT